MKRNIVLTGLIALNLCILSCRKGEDDPFFTLKSRKNRLCGEWKMTSYEKETINYNESGTLYSESITATETEGNQTYEGPSMIETSNYIYHDYHLTINEVGTWSIYKNLDFTYRYEDDTYTMISSGPLEETISGTWSFVNKSGEYQNKERLLINVLSEIYESGETTKEVDFSDPGMMDYIETYIPETVTFTYETGGKLQLYDLIELRSDKMKWQAVTGDGQDTWGKIILEFITWEAD